MTVTEIIDQFKRDYPGKNIICLPEVNPTEIICEIEPTTEHTGYSVIIAAEVKAVAHYHLKSTEVYEVLEGKLEFHVGNKIIALKPGGTYTVKPRQVHYAVGDWTIIKVTSYPGWTVEDHILANMAGHNG